MRRFTWFLILVSLVLAAVSCSDRPKDVLSESEMVDLLTDMALAEAYSSSSGSRSEGREALLEAVLKKHGVTQAQLDSTLEYYGRNIDEYDKIYEKVEKNLQAKNSTQGEEQAKEVNDIWPYGKFAAFLPGQMSDGITFSFPSSEIDKGSRLEWGMRLTQTEGTEMMLGVEYDDGTLSMYKNNPRGNSVKVGLQTDTAKTVKRLFGVMTARNGMRPFWADSIRLLKEPFDSMVYSKVRTQNKAGVLLQKPKQIKAPPAEENTDSVSTGNSVVNM